MVMRWRFHIFGDMTERVGVLKAFPTREMFVVVQNPRIRYLVYPDLIYVISAGSTGKDLYACFAILVISPLRDG